MSKCLWLLLFFMGFVPGMSQAEPYERRCIRVQNDTNVYIDFIANKTGWGCNSKNRILLRTTYTYYPEGLCGKSEIWSQVWTSSLKKGEAGPGRLLACKDLILRANESGTIIVMGKFDASGRELERLDCDFKRHAPCLFDPEHDN